MDIEEGPFFIIKEYRKIVMKAKNDRRKDSMSKTTQFTTHECIPQNMKNQINQILYQLTQPQKFEAENASKTYGYDDYMDDQAYFYYQKRQKQQAEQTKREITDIDDFLTLQENQTI